VVHGGVGIAQDFLRVGVAGAESDADADGDAELVSGNFGRLGDSADELVGEAGRVGRIADACEEDELVAADAGEGVAAADVGVDAGGNFNEEKVADVVTEGVVDLLEAV
jgi:hypothetical protein